MTKNKWEVLTAVLMTIIVLVFLVLPVSATTSSEQSFATVPVPLGEAVMTDSLMQP